MVNEKTCIPARVKKLVIQESSGVCAFCQETDVNTLEFHHIKGREIPDPDNSQNLIYVCSNCHSKITSGGITESEVQLQKRLLQLRKRPKQSGEQLSQTINISDSVNTGNITNIFNYKTSKANRLKLLPPNGSIADDLMMRNYTKHLIDRYNEFAKLDATKGKFSYGFIYQRIKKEFGAKWDLIPVTMFSALCTYLQKRIDNTIFGKTRKRRGQNNYSLFDEYVSKYVSPNSK